MTVCSEQGRGSRIVLAAALLALLAADYAFDLPHYLTLEMLQEKQALLQSYQSEHALTVMTAFFLIYVAVAALSIPGAALLTLLAGALFGFVSGVVLVSFASTIGATLAFLLARFLLRDWIQQRYQAQLATLNAGFAREGAFYLFAMRLIPLFPFFLINILTGLMPLSMRRFYVASQLGMLPGTAVYVYAGTELGKIKSLSGIASPSLIAAFVMLGLFPLVAKKVIAALRNRRMS